MRGNLSPVLVKLLQDEKGRKIIYEALTTGHAEVKIDEEEYEIAVVGHINGKQNKDLLEAKSKSAPTR